MGPNSILSQLFWNLNIKKYFFAKYPPPLIKRTSAKSLKILQRDAQLYTVRKVLNIQAQMDRQRGWQTAKRILMKNKDPNKTLMDYRNTEFQGIRTSA